MQGAGAVADGVFLLGSGFGKGFAEFGREEKRVVAESAFAAFFLEYNAFHAALGGEFAPVGVANGDYGAEARVARLACKVFEEQGVTVETE